MVSPEGFAKEVATRTPEQGYSEVIDRLEKLLGALDEALEQYSAVTLPGGETIDATNPQEQMLARAQTLRTGIEGLLEQVREKGERYAEEPVALIKVAVEHLEGYLAARTDLANDAEKFKGARRLVEVLDKITSALLPRDAANDSSYEIENVA